MDEKEKVHLPNDIEGYCPISQQAKGAGVITSSFPLSPPDWLRFLIDNQDINAHNKESGVNWYFCPEMPSAQAQTYNVILIYVRKSSQDHLWHKFHSIFADYNFSHTGAHEGSSHTRCSTVVLGQRALWLQEESISGWCLLPELHKHSFHAAWSSADLYRKNPGFLHNYANGPDGRMMSAILFDILTRCRVLVCTPTQKNWHTVQSQRSHRPTWSQVIIRRVVLQLTQMGPSSLLAF